MDDNELIREAYTLLGRGCFEAAETRFEEYLAKRIQVVGDGPLRATWAKSVAEKREQVAAQQRADEERAPKGLRGLLARR